MPKTANFAACLRRLREARGLTQVQLADRAQLSPAAVCQWEQGRRLPSWEAAVALARALGVSLDALAG